MADIHPDDAGLDGEDEADDRRHRELDNRRQRVLDQDAEAAAARYREKYGRAQASIPQTDLTPQSYLVPSVNDPTIFGIKCKPGKEREIIFAIKRRWQDRASGKEPLEIISAFERGGTMAGYVYVEAWKQPQVLKAVDNIPNAYPRSKMILVPINEMTDLLRVQQSKPVEPGMYVRVRRGKYQGDLAQVQEVDVNGLRVELKLIPRLDYGVSSFSEDINGPRETPEQATKRKRQAGLSKNSVVGRPPQRMFNEHEARKNHAKYLQQNSSFRGKGFTYFGDNYEDGFLLKDFKIQLLHLQDVNPTLEEITKFTSGADQGAENLDLQALSNTLKASNAAASYLPGDMVEIYHGEQKGIQGQTATIQGEIVTLKVTQGELTGQTIDAPVKTLRKLFREGDHVKVVGGSKYQDEVGMVVRIKDDRVSLLTDANNQEVTVFSKDLREASDSNIVSATSAYDFHDLVQLDSSTVACVIKVDRESLRVIDQEGTLRTVLPSSISGKLERRRHAASTDHDGIEIRNDDTVRESGGEQRQGRILHIYRSYLFLHNRQLHENAGVFVVRNNNVITVAAVQGRGSAAVDSNIGVKMSAANPLPPPPKTFGRDRLIGKTCTIRKGMFKGLLGIIKDTTETEARVELHTKNKVLNVAKTNLNIKDTATGQTIDMSRFGGPRPGSDMPMRGPSGGATPRVPAWDGSRTPALNGGQTPGWAAGGQGAAGGGRTPGWGMSNNTPRPSTWKPPVGSRTPAMPRNDGSGTAYGGGSRTPFGGATSYGGVS